MGFSSRKWAENISNIASRLYFFIIIVQIPLFRFPCRIGTCETPIDIMACQLIVSEILPQVVVKALVYPGAIKRSFMEGTTIPSPHQLLNSYKSNIRGIKPLTTDLKQLEVIAGCYLSVAGALLGLIKRGRISLFGLILIIWGITREKTTGKKHASHEDLYTYTEMTITIVIAFFSIRKDVRRLIRCCKPKRIVKRLKNYSKSKYKLS